jgi:hypothetical protein
LGKKHVWVMFMKVPISRINAYAQRVIWFIFNLQKKNRVTVAACINTQLFWLLLSSTRFILLEYCFIHTSVASFWQYRSEWVHPCWESFLSPYGVGRLATSHQRLGLAVLAWLSQILLLIGFPAQTLINHTDTHQG